jgi:SAM-dependent MidA family methyltransferase
MTTPQLSNDPGQQALYTLIQRSIANAGGWLGFDRFMALALYAPGMGYYANSLRKFGLTPETGSDFATAPEMSKHFGRTLSHQVAEALHVTGTDEVWEFGAGSGALEQAARTAMPDSGTKAMKRRREGYRCMSGVR